MRKPFISRFSAWTACFLQNSSAGLSINEMSSFFSFTRVIHSVSPHLRADPSSFFQYFHMLSRFTCRGFSKTTYAAAWQGRPTPVSGTRSPTFDLAPSPPSRSPPPFHRHQPAPAPLPISPTFFDYSLRRVLSFWLKVSTGELSNRSESILKVFKRDIAYCFTRKCLMSSCVYRAS